MQLVKLGVMLTETSLLTDLRFNLSDIVFECFSTEFFLNIIHNKSLNLFSTYYPLVTPAIEITRKHGVPEINPGNGKTAIFRYIVPNYNPAIYTYIDVFDSFFPQNDGYDSYANGTITPNIAVNNMMDQIYSLMPHVSTKFRAAFEFPHFIVVDPVPFSPETFRFAVKMKCRKNLNQIDSGLQEMFVNLVICDAKIAIKNSLPNLMNNNTFAGVEIETIVSKWDDAESERKEIIEFFENDWRTHPDNMSVQAIFNTR